MSFVPRVMCRTALAREYVSVSARLARVGAEVGVRVKARVRVRLGVKARVGARVRVSKIERGGISESESEKQREAKRGREKQGECER